MASSRVASSAPLPSYARGRRREMGPGARLCLAAGAPSRNRAAPGHTMLRAHPDESSALMDANGQLVNHQPRHHPHRRDLGSVRTAANSLLTIQALTLLVSPPSIELRRIPPCPPPPPPPPPETSTIPSTILTDGTFGRARCGAPSSSITSPPIPSHGRRLQPPWGLVSCGQCVSPSQIRSCPQISNIRLKIDLAACFTPSDLHHSSVRIKIHVGGRF
ncbi:unnamed protein product [Urochloa humidicola]